MNRVAELQQKAEKLNILYEKYDHSDTGFRIISRDEEGNSVWEPTVQFEFDQFLKRSEKYVENRQSSMSELVKSTSWQEGMLRQYEHKIDCKIRIKTEEEELEKARVLREAQAARKEIVDESIAVGLSAALIGLFVHFTTK